MKSDFDCFVSLARAGNNMAEIIYKEESYKIIGACFEVYKQKGCGFTELVYHECLKVEFEIQNIPYVYEPSIQL